jgi:hypothetical protein
VLELGDAAGVTGAATVVGLVLLEAIVLYVVYGGLERFLGPALVDAVSGR